MPEGAIARADFESVVPEIVPFRVPRAIQRILVRALRIGELESIYDLLRSMTDSQPFPERLLALLSISYRASDVELRRIPQTGPVLVIVNHPFGILEGAVLASLLGRIRADLRFLGNRILMRVPEIRNLVIPLETNSGCDAVVSNSRALKKALDHLSAKGLLILFPAGEVSHFQWKMKAISDPQWGPTSAWIVEVAARLGICVPVIPMYFSGANSALFHVMGMLHPGFRTALLCRELLNKRGRSVEVRIGSTVRPEKLLAISDESDRIRYLRWRTYLLAGLGQYKPRTRLGLRRRIETKCGMESVAEAQPSTALAGEIATLDPLVKAGELEVYLTTAGRVPSVLHELGRLREVTFRAAKEGTGKPLDIDSFDATYLHLFVWNPRRQEIIGAYRMAATDRVSHGGLYTAALFGYRREFLDWLGAALELGRSFIRQEYQRSFAPLLLLWKGIGRFISQNPRYKMLFGPVSISNRYHALSRELMVSFLEQRASVANFAGHRDVRGYTVRGVHRPICPQSGFDIEDLSAVISDVEQDQSGVPVLLRHYLKLGGRLLGFQIDRKFSDALDGLILVDLTKTEPKLLGRYLGSREAADFLAHHNMGRS